MRKYFVLYLCLFFTSILFAQNVQISGIVTDEENEPIIGASVVVKGTKQGSITDLDGKFSLSISTGSTLSISYIGYETFEEKITTANTAMRVVLKNNSYMLTEVVAIGYGTMKKSDLTGAVASVKADQLQKTPAAGLDQALQGRVAGVTVNANSGQPGAAAEVRIRGIGTVNNSAPIYVVDGVIVDNITFLSPNDIESTEILKDASSTAIYGSRGANGVILVTTKKGKAGKSTISFNSYVGFQNRWRKLDLMQRDEFASTIVALNNVTSEINFFNKNGFSKWLQAYRLGSPYYPVNLDYSQVETDWQDEVFNENALIQNHHVSVSGGTDKSTYAFSASYFDQEGTIIGSDYNRLTLRINSSHKVRSWLTIGENLSFVSSTGRNAMNNNANPGASILSAALAMAPWDPTHYPSGSINNENKDLSGQISASSNYKNTTNPFSMVQNIVPNNNVERWVGDLYVELSPIKHLTLRSSINLDLSNNRDKTFNYAYEYSSFDKSEKNFLSSSMSRYSTVVFDNILTYSRSAGLHDWSAMVGQTTQEYNYYSIGGSGYSILNPELSNWYLSQTTEKNVGNDSAIRTRMFSLLGRLHYTYAGKYLATLNFRSDASSKFTENPWGYFPSTALAWRMTEESWMPKIAFVDFLKLRVGWGRIGNEKIASDSFIMTMFNEGPTFVDYVLGTDQQLASGSAILSYVNKNGKWESTEQWNAGLDFGFFNGLLGGNVDLFLRDTKDMILPVKAPAHIGNLHDPLANVGTVRNKGIEISFDHSNKIRNVNYSIGANLSLIDNKLTALNGGSRIYGDRTIVDEGYALYTFWGYQYLGIYESNDAAKKHLYNDDLGFKAGDAKFADLNKNGKLDDGDKTDLGNPFPWLTYGLNIAADYKGFDLQLFFQGVYGNEIFNAVRIRTEGTGVDGATLSTAMRDAWTASNPLGSIPNPYGNAKNYDTSSRFIESGAYLRLKNLQIGYTLPNTLVNNFFIDRCRFYISASNLLTITNYTGYDPEIGSGVDYGNYPQSRTITFGVNVDF